MEPVEIPAKVINVNRAGVGALVTGIVVFAIVVIAMQTSAPAIAQDMTLIAYLGIGMLAIMVPMQFFFLPTVDAGFRKRIDPSFPNTKQLLENWTGRTITGCALMEGAAFLCLTGALLDGRPLGLVGGLTAAALMLVLHWPTEPRLREYVERQRELAMMERNS